MMRIKKLFTKSLLLLTFILMYSHVFSNLENTSYLFLSKPLDQENTTTYKIQGKITDSKTGEIIPLCNITLGNSYNGTFSNEEGEFVLTIKSVPTKLTFTHLNYESFSIVINESQTLNIRLTPLVNILDEIELKPSNVKDKYAISLAKKTFDKTNSLSSIKKYGKAFYRQKSKNGGEYSELSEIIYDIKYNSSGINDWEILEGRYAVKEEKINNKNFTLFSKLLQSLQPYTDDLIFPLRSDFESFYTVRLIDMIKTKNSKIAVLYFKPLQHVTTSILEGEIYVDTNTHQLLKVQATLLDDNFKSVKFKEKNIYKKNYSLAYEMGFKETTKDNFVMDYIKVDQEFDYFKDDVLKTHVSSNSNLTFFEHYIPKTEKILGSSFIRNNSDWENLNTIGYNKKFWKENPIIKRTPVEDEVIAAFEKNNAFESIFLNSREQISLMQEKLFRNPLIKRIDTLLRYIQNYEPTEKVFLHLDKNTVSVGDDIWVSAYAVLGANHYLSNASKVVYIDLISPQNKTVLSKQILLENGKGRGNVEIPKNLKPGLYQIRSYTQWMRNNESAFFFKKSIKILSPRNNTDNRSNTNQMIDLQFFPEGGNAIVGINGKLAFKAINGNGKGIDVNGSIINSKGATVANFKSQFKGAGSVNFKPLPNEKYTAVLKNKTTYPITKISNKGYAMLVNNIGKKSVEIKIQASKDLLDKHFYVIGTIRGKKYYQGKFDFGGKSLVSLEIPKRKLPSGVLTITIFDQAMKPWAERIVFINNNESLIVNAKIDKTFLKSKEKIKVDINISDTEGTPVSTEFSLSLTDLKKHKKEKNSSNITSYLLLESDIKGYIDEPSFYFNNPNRSTKYKLDLIMRTNGWRRFNWMTHKKNLVHQFEKGTILSGIAKTMRHKVLENTLLKIITINKENIQTFTTLTDINGRFKIEEFNLTDSTKVIFNLPSNKKNPLNVRVQLDTRTSLNKSIPESNYFNFNSSKLSRKELNYSKKILKRKIQDSISNIDPFADVESTLLNEVEIIGAVKKKTNVTPSVYGLKPDAVIYPKTNTGESLVTMISNVSGIQAKSTRKIGFDNKVLSIRGRDGSPIWVVDGMRYPTSGGENSPDIDMNDIERIEIIKSAAKGAIYGPDGKNGVILIYTKRAQRGQNSKKVFSSEFNIKGYERSKEFYAPKYTDKTASKKDNRTTLFWSPSIKTDSSGNASIIFYNSDTAKKIQLVIEALSEFGIPGSYIKSFNLKR